MIPIPRQRKTETRTDTVVSIVSCQIMGRRAGANNGDLLAGMIQRVLVLRRVQDLTLELVLTVF